MVPTRTLFLDNKIQIPLTRDEALEVLEDVDFFREYAASLESKAANEAFAVADDITVMMDYKGWDTVALDIWGRVCP